MLGFTLENLDVRSLDDAAFAALRGAVPEHGVVCVRQQQLDIEDLISLTRRFGEPVLLPEGLRFNNTLDQYPELARVSNIRPDGTLIKQHQAAEYWHVDGDFWQPGQNYIYNFLYSVQVPEQGGKTGFADLRRAYEVLDEGMKARIRDLQFLSSCAAIPDFEVASPDEYLPDAYHNITHVHVETGRQGLYVNYPTTQIHGVSEAESEEILAALFSVIDTPENTYQHDWQAGDLLIWDNTSVMHRSMGGYADSPRLLYRTQAFMQPRA
ncbi:MAG: TauD/TfdA family dioxygenase [Halieaceae bacterium]|jgi:taurine dioxygenase|nr:TauD/TfdA family dioxygenase [Halieaceae bacterium]